jgi:hypothetical protein
MYPAPVPAVFIGVVNALLRTEGLAICRLATPVRPRAPLSE